MIVFASKPLGATRPRTRFLLRSKALVFSSHGDTNGLFYYLGTTFGTTAWANPFTLGFVGFTPVPDGKFNNSVTDLPQNYVNRSTTHVDTSGTAPLSYIIDLRYGNSLILDRFAYRYRSDSTSFTPTAWTVEGSNDNSTWTLVLTVTGQTPALGGWVSSTTTGQATTTAYRYWRVKQTASDQTGFFTTGQIEMYGTFFPAFSPAS